MKMAEIFFGHFSFGGTRRVTCSRFASPRRYSCKLRSDAENKAAWKSSFINFVDRMFTTFIERAFTNARDASLEMPAIA
jgi:hypothetical protein